MTSVQMKPMAAKVTPQNEAARRGLTEKAVKPLSQSLISLPSV